MYYIYHIPGEKIGTSVEPAERVAKQGYTKFDVLEVHSDIYEASDREIELQKEYGYKVDTIPYWVSVQNRPKWTDEARAKGKAGRTAWCSELGKRGNRLRFKDPELIKQIRAEYKGNSKNQFNRTGPTLSELAKKYNTSISTISRICRSSDAYESR